MVYMKTERRVSKLGNIKLEFLVEIFFLHYFIDSLVLLVHFAIKILETF